MTIGISARKVNSGVIHGGEWPFAPTGHLELPLTFYICGAHALTLTLSLRREREKIF